MTEDLDVNIPRPSLRTEMYIYWGRGSLGSVCLGFEHKMAWSGRLQRKRGGGLLLLQTYVI